jgi:ribosomal protein L40E
MSSSRPNLTQTPLSLDEQSFQGLLAAAFTIQEHNDRRKKVREQEARSEPAPEPASRSLCPQCGAEKAAEESRCGKCGMDELRPGERLQRNWASMWLMSQEQGLWPGRSAGSTEASEQVEDANEDGPHFPGSRPPHKRAVSAVTASNFLGSRPSRNAEKETSLAEAEDMVRSLFDDGPATRESSAEAHWTGEGDKPAEREAIFGAKPDAASDATFDDRGIESESHGSPFESSASDNSHAIAVISIAGNAEKRGDASDEVPGLLPRKWADLEVTLRFHRADLYLGLAVFVALIALLWPAASAPKQASVGPWQRALISMGIAEAPAPVIHLQGDPGVQVWIDPHTALYYCPGSDAYGKTADGRFSSQRDAQVDRFEPAARSVCE